MLRTITEFNLLYYFQADILCELILIFLLFSVRRIKERTVDRKLFLSFVIVTMIFTAFDFMTWVFDGMSGKFAYVLMEFSNIGFYISTTLISLLWCYYVVYFVKMNKGLKYHTNIWYAVPLVLFSILCATNPAHHLIWIVYRSTNTYARGPAIYIHWALVAAYLIIPTFYLIYVMCTEKSKVERRKYSPPLFILGIPIICAVLQSLFYGLSLLQVGMTATVLYTYVRQQSSTAYIDELTGIYNRRYLNNYIKEKYDIAKKDDKLFVLMMDIDHFKEINDTHGHLAGDNVLRTMGWILRTVVLENKGSIAARYGGDEFMIFGFNYDEEAVDKIIADIQKIVEDQNNHDSVIQVSISVGKIYGVKALFDSTDQLLSLADKEMYEIKKRRNNKKAE